MLPSNTLVGINRDIIASSVSLHSAKKAFRVDEIVETTSFNHSCSSFSLFLLLPRSFADGKSDKEILDLLLRNSRYDKRLLPPVDGK
jgi:hypothetical protein